MKLTDQQAMLLLQIAQESIITSHFSMSVEKRQVLVNTIIAQQSNTMVDLEDENKLTKHDLKYIRENMKKDKCPRFGTELSFGDGRTEK